MCGFSLGLNILGGQDIKPKQQTGPLMLQGCSMRWLHELMVGDGTEVVKGDKDTRWQWKSWKQRRDKEILPVYRDTLLTMLTSQTIVGGKWSPEQENSWENVYCLTRTSQMK